MPDDTEVDSCHVDAALTFDQLYHSAASSRCATSALAHKKAVPCRTRCARAHTLQASGFRVRHRCNTFCTAQHSTVIAVAAGAERHQEETRAPTRAVMTVIRRSDDDSMHLLHVTAGLSAVRPTAGLPHRTAGCTDLPVRSAQCLLEHPSMWCQVILDNS